MLASCQEWSLFFLNTPLTSCEKYLVTYIYMDTCGEKTQNKEIEPILERSLSCLHELFFLLRYLDFVQFKGGKRAAREVSVLLLTKDQMVV